MFFTSADFAFAQSKGNAQGFCLDSLGATFLPPCFSFLNKKVDNSSWAFCPHQKLYCSSRWFWAPVALCCPMGLIQ